MLLKPMEVMIGAEKVKITWESLLWFWFFTMLGTVMGAIAYAYLEQYLPNLPANATTAATRPVRK